LTGVSVEAQWCVATSGTADAPLICRCDDGSDYAVKGAATNPSLPHQEYFCARLGELAGVISPPIRIVKNGGKECFGSRWESGVETGVGQADGCGYAQKPETSILHCLRLLSRGFWRSISSSTTWIV